MGNPIEDTGKEVKVEKLSFQQIPESVARA